MKVDENTLSNLFKVGEPIEVDKVTNPSKQEVDDLHAYYLDR